MPLPANTPVTLKARLVGLGGRQIQGEVVASALTLSGPDQSPPQAVELGRGTPAADGALLIAVNHEKLVGAEFHSRIQLAIRPPRVRNPRAIAETPAQVRGATIDFGVVEVRDEVLFALGDTSFYGFSKPVLDALAGPPPAAVPEVQQRLEALDAQIQKLSETVSRGPAQERADALRQPAQPSEILQGQIVQLTAEKNRAEVQVSTLTAENAQLRQATDRLQSDLAAAQQAQSAAQASAASLAAERQALQQSNTALAAEVATARQERAAAQAAVDGLKESLNTRSSLGDLVENVGTQLRSAHETLSSTSTPFKLGRVAMELKVLPSEHGTGFNFPTRDEVQRISGEQLSVLQVDFTAVSPSTPPAGPPAVEVPDLLGVTEVMARRLLAGAGLTLQSGFLAVPRAAEGAASQAGRVVKQLPAAHERVTPGSIVTALFGKE